MYGMNFLFGNNFGFGGFGCFCRPVINPFMLGAMQGYTSAMCAYSMMGGIFSTPSLFNFNMYSQPQNYNYPLVNYNYQQIPAVNPFSTSSFQELLTKTREASANLQQQLKSGTASSDTTVKPESTSTVKSSEVKSSVDFKTKVEQAAKNLVCKPEDLLALMNSESGLNAKAQNKSGQGAVGLIQFTEPAIKELNRHGINITKEQLLNMDEVEQMDYVEKYLKIAKSYKFTDDCPLTAGDLYAINYLPGKASLYNLASRGDIYYEANKGLDADKDGVITKDDLAKRLDKFRVSLVA